MRSTGRWKALKLSSASDRNAVRASSGLNTRFAMLPRLGSWTDLKYSIEIGRNDHSSRDRGPVYPYAVGPWSGGTVHRQGQTYRRRAAVDDDFTYYNAPVGKLATSLSQNSRLFLSKRVLEELVPDPIMHIPDRAQRRPKDCGRWGVYECERARGAVPQPTYVQAPLPCRLPHRLN